MTWGMRNLRPPVRSGQSSGAGIMVPTDIVVAETAHGTFVIVASTPGNGTSGCVDGDAA